LYLFGQLLSHLSRWYEGPCRCSKRYGFRVEHSSVSNIRIWNTWIFTAVLSIRLHILMSRYREKSGSSVRMTSFVPSNLIFTVEGCRAVNVSPIRYFSNKCIVSRSSGKHTFYLDTFYARRQNSCLNNGPIISYFIKEKIVMDKVNCILRRLKLM